MADLPHLLDPKEVTFALVKVPIGSGTFARHKVILCVVVDDEKPGRTAAAASSSEIFCKAFTTSASYFQCAGCI